MFQKLSEIFSDENNYSLSRELLIKVRNHREQGDGKLPCLTKLGQVEAPGNLM